jgi:hypothetical protein
MALGLRAHKYPLAAGRIFAELVHAGAGAGA